MPTAMTMRALAPLLVTASLADWPLMPMPDANDFWRGSALQDALQDPRLLQDARLPTLKETDDAYQVRAQ